MDRVLKKSTLYQKAYGAWAGFPTGFGPNYTRCCAEVTDTSTRWGKHYQCQRKRGYGPDKAYCAVHDPAKVQERNAKNALRANATWLKRRYEIHGQTFFAALETIAKGHKDARKLAQRVINKFNKGG